MLRSLDIALGFDEAGVLYLTRPLKAEAVEFKFIKGGEIWVFTPRGKSRLSISVLLNAVWPTNHPTRYSSS